MAIHSSILAQKIPWTEEPGGLWSMELQITRHDRAAEHTHTHRLKIQIQKRMSALKTKIQPRIREQLTHGKRKMTKHHPREPLNIKLTLANNWDKFSSRRILHVSRKTFQRLILKNHLINFQHYSNTFFKSKNIKTQIGKIKAKIEKNIQTPQTPNYFCFSDALRLNFQYFLQLLIGSMILSSSSISHNFRYSDASLF